MVDGEPFTEGQAARITRVLETAQESTGLIFSVYVGGLREPVREHAQELHGRFVDPARSVLFAISPNQRVLEIVTGEVARTRLSDRVCQIAALSMTAAFGGGDLAGGVMAGVAQLADHAGYTSHTSHTSHPDHPIH